MENQNTQNHRLELGRTIRSKRTEQGFSTRGFADMVGINRSHLLEIESGKASPTIDMLERIAGGLGIPVADLIDF